MLVSIIIPVYNGMRYISEAIKSVLSQTYKDLEIIVIDDGSIDSSASIIKELQNEDSRIFYYYKLNGGIVSARNYGLVLSRGEYICFMDQDDVMHPQMVEILMNCLTMNIADMAQCCAVSFSEKIDDFTKCIKMDDYTQELYLNGTAKHKLAVEKLIIRGEYDACESMNNRGSGTEKNSITSNEQTKVCIKYPLDGAIWNKMVRRSLLADNHIKLRQFCDYEDDWIYVIECAMKANKICIIDSALYGWRNNEKSESRDRIKKDKYIGNFLSKHQYLVAFLLENLEAVGTRECMIRSFEEVLEKQQFLWCLSNETGRGIEGRDIKDSTLIMKDAMRIARNNGISVRRLIKPLCFSLSGSKDELKKGYYSFRDSLLSVLLYFHFERFAVILNKYLLHGRWHI